MCEKARADRIARLHTLRQEWDTRDAKKALIVRETEDKAEVVTARIAMANTVPPPIGRPE